MNNAFSHAYAEQALKLCRDIYLRDGQTKENDDKLMVASMMGGLSLTYSEVGVCHALSYGLSKIFGTKHCFANCVIFQHLEDIYPQGVAEFRQMLKKQNIQLPVGLSKSWSEDEVTAMSEVAIKLSHMWRHAFGEDWQQKISVEWIKELYKRM